MVSKMVRHGKAIVDVGTDHAYLPTYLILNDIIPNAIAADLREGPLENARQTVGKYEVSQKIKLVLSDGLKNLEGCGLTDFVIAGMGGNLISTILSESKWVEKKGNHFVLQPQSHAEDLREYLMSRGFEIIREDITSEGRHLYLAMEVTYAGKVKAFTDEEREENICFGKIWESDSPKKVEFMEAYENRLYVKRNALLLSQNDEEAEIERLNRIITKIEDKLENIQEGKL